VIENKSVQALVPIHEAQLLTYMKLSGCRLGFLVNWNVPLIKDGIKRIVNKL
jgi:GxxExxY protein